MPAHLRRAAQRVAKHEAGHFIVSRVHGFPTGAVFATVLDSSGAFMGGSEITLARPLASLEDVSLYLTRRIQVLYAGALAESLTANGKVVNGDALSVRSTAAKDDFSRATELIQLARNLKHPEPATHEEFQVQLNAIDGEAWNAAAACVEKEHLLILGLAGRMEEALMAAGLGVEARMAAATIDALPAMIARFAAN